MASVWRSTAHTPYTSSCVRSLGVNTWWRVGRRQGQGGCRCSTGQAACRGQRRCGPGGRRSPAPGDSAAVARPPARGHPLTCACLLASVRRRLYSLLNSGSPQRFVSAMAALMAEKASGAWRGVTAPACDSSCRSSSEARTNFLGWPMCDAILRRAAATWSGDCAAVAAAALAAGCSAAGGGGTGSDAGSASGAGAGGSSADSATACLVPPASGESRVEADRFLAVDRRGAARRLTLF